MPVLYIDGGRPRHQFPGPGFIECIEMFLDKEVGNDSCQLQTYGRGYGTAALVRSDPGSICLRYIRGRDRVGDTAERHRLGLINTDVSAASQRFKLAHFVELFSCGHRNGAAERDLIDEFDTLDGCGFFPPEDIQLC